MHADNDALGKVLDQFSQIDSYLRNELNEDEARDFEIRMLDDPDFSKEVEFQASFFDALKSESALIAPLTSKQGYNFFDWIRHPFSVAVAGSFSLLLVVGILPLIPSQEQIDAEGAFMVRGSTIIQPTRSSAVTQTIEGPPPYLLQIDVGLAGSETKFDVNLVNANSQESVMTSAEVSPDGGGWLWLVVDRNLQGAHRLEIVRKDSGMDPEGEDILLSFQ